MSRPVLLGGLLFLCLANVCCGIKQLDPYNDEIQYKIDWLDEVIGDNQRDIVPGINDEVGIVIHTNNEEMYKCKVPHFTEDISNIDDESRKEHLSPDVLLSEVFQSNECVYLVEGYWSYELCHGLHLKQFHEDKGQDGKVTNVLEFILGKQTNGDFPPKASIPPPVWQYNGIEYPYYEVQFTGGTPCDIREDAQRSTKLAYICDKDHSVVPSLVMVKESKTCEYEAVIVTNQLCANEAYRLKEKPVYNIKCYASDGSPRTPKALDLYKAKAGTGSGGKLDSKKSTDRSIRPPSPPPSPVLDEKFIGTFLQAEYCPLGKSSGWWQHELCFEKHVRQVHLEGGSVRQVVVLGYWDEEEHKRWFAKAGKTKKSRTHVTHLYSGGELCDLTATPRRVRVKFRCLPEGLSSKLSVFLEEPTPCNYILTIEAGFICQLLETVDGHGLFHYEIA